MIEMLAPFFYLYSDNTHPCGVPVYSIDPDGRYLCVSASGSIVRYSPRGLHIVLPLAPAKLDPWLLSESLLIAAWCAASGVKEAALKTHFKTLSTPLHSVIELPGCNRLAVAEVEFRGQHAQQGGCHGAVLNLTAFARVE